MFSNVLSSDVISFKSIRKGLKVENNVDWNTHGFLGCTGGIKSGDNTLFRNYVSIHSENHKYEDINIPIRLQGTNRKGMKIGKNC